MRKAIVISAIVAFSAIGGGIANADTNDRPAEKKVGALYIGTDNQGNHIYYDKDETQIMDFDEDGFYSVNPYKN